MNQHLTKRVISPGAEKWLFEPIQIHDKGYVELVSYDGDDIHIANSARISFGEEPRKVSDDATLIRYLRRHRHTTPFEQVGLSFRMRAPLFVIQQVLRHRTFSFNQESRRYTPDKGLFFIPERPGPQSTTNKQGTQENGYTEQEIEEIRTHLQEACQRSYDEYEFLLQEYNLSYELARTLIPASSYSSLVLRVDLHNLMHFLGLRLHPHAQKEIRDYAEAIARVAKDAFPIAYESFEDYVLGAVTLTRKDVAMLGLLLKDRTASPLVAASEPATPENACLQVIIPNKREQDEFLAKMAQIFKFDSTEGSGRLSHDDFAELHLEAARLQKEDPKQVLLVGNKEVVKFEWSPSGVKKHVVYKLGDKERNTGRIW